MSLKDLHDRARREGKALDDLLLTLREVAQATGEPYTRIRYWVYTDRSIPIVRFGPNAKPRVKASVIVQMFAPHEDPKPVKPVRYVPSAYRPCATG